MNVLLPFGIILASTVFGLTGLPLWTGIACGMLLVAIAAAERTTLASRAIRVGKAGTLSLAAGASLVNAQAASIGAFAIGRLLGGLLV
jgi:hypothetical protein